jgi:hypothetical protein
MVADGSLTTDAPFLLHKYIPGGVIGRFLIHAKSVPTINPDPI